MKALRGSPPQGDRRAPRRNDRALRKWLRGFAAIYVAGVNTALMGAVALIFDVGRVAIVEAETEMQHATAAFMGAPSDRNGIETFVVFPDVFGHTIYAALRHGASLAKF